MSHLTADADSVLDGTGVIYVCEVCDVPVESEPCKEHQPAAYLCDYLSFAHEGARCKVPGFEDWVASKFNGWVQDETGWSVTHLYLANLMVQSGFRYDAEASA